MATTKMKPKPNKWLHSRRWSLKLFKKREFKDPSFISRDISCNSQDDVLEEFLDEGKSPRPSRRPEVIRRFCEVNTSGDDLDPQEIKPGRAWVDCRSLSTEPDQGITKRLDSVRLAEVLSSQRFDLVSDTESFRHLIHIAQLDRNYILSLIHTAWNHQAGPLRDAIHKHLDGRPSMQVRVNPIGHKILVLELHLPYLALRTTTVENSSNTEELRTDGEWEDLSFLEANPSGSDTRSWYRIHDIQSSVMICVWDFKKWAAYAFTNSALNDESDDDNHLEEESQFEDGEALCEGYLDDGYVTEDVQSPEDVVVSDRDGIFLGAQDPTWCPLKYYTRVMQARSSIVLDEWAYLVEEIAPCIKRKNNSLRCTFWRSQKEECVFSTARDSLSWITAATTFLRGLRNKISETDQSWRRFNSTDGDGNYFRELRDNDISLTFDAIRKTFADMSTLKKRIDLLYEECNETARLIELYMTRESNQLNRESIRYSMQGNRFSMKANQVNLDSYRLTHGMNLNSAITLSTNQIMVPAAIVATLFSIQEDTFGFKKGPASFITGTISLYAVIRILSLVTFLLRKHVPANLRLALLLLGQLDRLENNQRNQQVLIEVMPASQI